MKRKHRGARRDSTGNILQDFSPAQLEAMGRVAVLYNEAEVQVDMLVILALDLRSAGIHVTSRINGVDGRIALAKIGFDIIGANESTKIALAETIGENGFQGYKKYRDNIMHSRILNAHDMIAISPHTRGEFNDVIVSTDALNGIFNRLEILRLELIAFCNVAINLLSVKRYYEAFNFVHSSMHDAMIPSFDLHKSNIEQRVQSYLAQVLEHQSRRRSLPPLPEFPAEPEDRRDSGAS